MDFQGVPARVESKGGFGKMLKEVELEGRSVSSSGDRCRIERGPAADGLLQC